jgi:hypothetical protein
MTHAEELHRKAMLHDQAAALLRADAERHEADAKRLRGEAAAMKLEVLSHTLPSDFCLLCGGAPDVIGIFKPEEPLKYGATPGKTRFVRYCLCSKCHGRPETPEKAEKIIRAELAGGGVTHAE